MMMAKAMTTTDSDPESQPDAEGAAAAPGAPTGPALPRVAPPRVSAGVSGAPRPPMNAEGSADAFRQLTFVLGPELELVLEGLALESGIAAASTGAKLRNQTLAALLGHWSRAWLHRMQALHALQWGNYTAAMPLIASAAVLLDLERRLVATSAAEWREWLATAPMALAPEDHASELRLHPPGLPQPDIAGLDRSDRLGLIISASGALARVDFGSTLLFAGHGSDSARVAIAFGERDFHLGLAELEMGWLIELSAIQVALARNWTAVLAAVDGAGADRFAAGAAAALARAERCRIEAAERGGRRRWLLHNWRARPGGAPRRLLL